LLPPAGGKLVIVNLQSTPKDKKATLLIHGKTDEVMKQVYTSPFPPDQQDHQ